MILLRCPLIALVALCAVTRAAAADKSLWPPVSGELSGKFLAPKLAHFPEVTWKTSIRALEGTKAHAEISATAVGGRLKAEADFDLLTGDGFWKITESELDAETWFPVIAPELGEVVSGLKAIGTLRLEGGGILKKNRPAGYLKVAWNGGALRNPDQGWALEDIALRGEYEVNAEAYTVKSVSPLEITVRTVTTTRFGARNVFVQGRLNEEGTFSLLVARVEIAGGEITIDPCTVPLKPPVVDFKVHIDRIGLQDVVALVPGSLSDARGRVDGVVRLGWSSAAGFQLGAGNISLRNDEPAMVRLTPASGLLTKRLSERIVFLPAWTGPLARWLAPVNPAYNDLRSIEMGRTDLQVQELGIELTPEGDVLGRSAQVHVRARPAQVGGSVKEVTFQVNVAGPLSAVLGVGLKQGMTIQFH